MARRKPVPEVSATLINHLIARRGMTANDIAEILGVDKSFVSRVRSLQRDLSASHFLALAGHVGMPLGALLLESDPVTEPLTPEQKKIGELCAYLVRRCDAAAAALRPELGKRRKSA